MKFISVSSPLALSIISCNRPLESTRFFNTAMELNRRFKVTLTVEKQSN